MVLCGTPSMSDRCLRGARAWRSFGTVCVATCRWELSGARIRHAACGVSWRMVARPPDRLLARALARRASLHAARTAAARLSVVMEWSCCGHVVVRLRSMGADASLPPHSSLPPSPSLPPSLSFAASSSAMHNAVLQYTRPPLHDRQHTKVQRAPCLRFHPPTHPGRQVIQFGMYYPEAIH